MFWEIERAFGKLGRPGCRMFLEIGWASGKLGRPGCRMFWEIGRAWARRGGTKPPQGNPKTIIGGSAFSVSGRAWNTLRQGAKKRWRGGAIIHPKIEKAVQPMVVPFWGVFEGLFCNKM